MGYEDRTLLRLKRQYSKDETVKALSKKLSEVEFRNGELQSEIDELRYAKKEEKNKSNTNKSYERLKIKYDKRGACIQKLEKLISMYQSSLEKGVTIKSLKNRDVKIDKLQLKIIELESSRDQLILRLNQK